jgi:hypothetical protein
MGSTRRRRKVAKTAQVQADGFESLRHAFHAGLEGERVRFVSLSAALARAESNPSWIFDDLQFRAHRLQGGAAIFEVANVAVAAGALEQAAVCASNARADNTDEQVWAALVTLVRSMGSPESRPQATPA